MKRGAMTYLSPFRRLLAVSTSAPMLGLALACAVPLASCGQGREEHPPLEGAEIGGPFTLFDKAGKPHTWDSFKGQWRIVYFGYTFCPDACPMDVQAMMKGFALFTRDHAAAAAKVQPIFVTIDPARDTPEIVGQWTGAFGPRLLGLTGSAAQVKQAADAFAVYYKKGENTPGGYLMDHSRIAYLMDPDGKPIAMLPVDKGPEAVAGELAKWVN
ncbi:SCO family protein [Novosphingobium sp. KA1]|nr:SCO family protein [Novosphingobium sp. KA1]